MSRILQEEFEELTHNFVENSLKGVLYLEDELNSAYAAALARIAELEYAAVKQRVCRFCVADGEGSVEHCPTCDCCGNDLWPDEDGAEE